MSNPEAENIYAPPSTDVSIAKSDKTTYLEHDGYSERGMFLCNEHFSPPSTCLKTGKPCSETQKICVARYLSTFKDSASVKRAWMVRLALILVAGLVMNQQVTLFILVVFLFSHRILNFVSSEKIILNVNISDEYLRKRRLIQLGFAVLAVVAAISLGYQFLYFTKKLPILIAVGVLIVSLRTALNLSNTLTFVRKKGDFYYLKGAHPYFLADLPLR